MLVAYRYCVATWLLGSMYATLCLDLPTLTRRIAFKQNLDGNNDTEGGQEVRSKSADVCVAERILAKRLILATKETKPVQSLEEQFHEDLFLLIESLNADRRPYDRLGTTSKMCGELFREYRQSSAILASFLKVVRSGELPKTSVNIRGTS